MAKLSTSATDAATPFAAAADPQLKVAVVLSGCGVYDGAEVTEAVSTLIHLTSLGIKVSCFAPDAPQMHVVNHLTGEVEEGVQRNSMVEAARITRGKVSPLSELRVQDVDGIIFPGGFGAAKNLCNYAVSGPEMTVNPEVEKVITAAHAAKKPLSFMCIAPVLAARLLPGVNLTVGGDKEADGTWPFAGTAAHIDAMGAKHEVTDHDSVTIDSENLVTSGSAYMKGTAEACEVFDNIGTLVDAFVEQMDQQVTQQ